MMPKKLNKKQVLELFRSEYADFLKEHRYDAIAKREEFNNFVDYLNKEGQVSDRQAYEWSNPY
jgi:hypothetical protein